MEKNFKIFYEIIWRKVEFCVEGFLGISSLDLSLI